MAGGVRWPPCIGDAGGVERGVDQPAGGHSDGGTSIDPGRSVDEAFGAGGVEETQGLFPA